MGPRVKQLTLFGREIEAGQWRSQLLKRLESENEDELAERLRKCGLEFALWCKECGFKHTAGIKCNRKWCPSCGPKRANERARRLRFAVKLMKWPMQITLTCQNVPLEDAPPTLLQDLMASFGKLRRSKLWSTNVTGGVSSVEITDKGNGLHPHIHALIDCRWLALKTPAPHRDDDGPMMKEKFRCAAQELQGTWARCLGQETPPSLWIRRCDAGAADEVMKYAMKSEDALNCRGKIGPVLRMLDSIRCVRPFGSMHGMEWPDDDDYKLTCPAGHSNWTPMPPLDATDRRTHRERIAEQRAREFEERLAKERFDEF